MLTGANCLTYHCLRAWANRLRMDGPEPPLLATPRLLHLAREAHAARIASLEAKAEALKGGHHG